jgi:hypothetical protein
VNSAAAAKPPRANATNARRTSSTFELAKPVHHNAVALPSTSETLEGPVADRTSNAHLFSEVIATLGLVLVIFSLARIKWGAMAPAAVGAYIDAAYFFTSSTSFANPAITVGRMFSEHAHRDRTCVDARLRRGAARRRCRRDPGDQDALSRPDARRAAEVVFER